MKFNYLAAVVALVMLLSCSEQKGEIDVPDLPKPKEKKDLVSYSIGYQIGSQLKMDSLDPNMQYLVMGIQKALAGDTSFMKLAEVDIAVDDWRKEKQVAMQKAQEEMAAKASKENPAFLEKNKNKSGVQVTASGLQYEVIKKGTGATPKPDEMIKFNSIGTFIDGKEFDNTYKTNQPATVPINALFPGLKEAFLMMNVGSKYRFVVPPELAFGSRGAAPGIPPNSILVFEIELVSIEGKAPQQQQPMMPPPNQQMPPQGRN
jgi:FKBP-type peptidyl-prolyl cis-trans isomerase FklB